MSIWYTGISKTILVINQKKTRKRTKKVESISKTILVINSIRATELTVDKHCISKTILVINQGKNLQIDYRISMY